MSTLLTYPENPGTRQGIISLSIKDKQVLYASYMPFIKNGGIFIPTSKRYDVGEQVFILIKLLDETDKIAVTGKVVWMTPKAAVGNRPAGIGVQFLNDEGALLRDKIEALLAVMLTIDKPTYTL